MTISDRDRAPLSPNSLCSENSSRALHMFRDGIAEIRSELSQFPLDRFGEGLATEDPNPLAKLFDSWVR